MAVTRIVASLVAVGQLRGEGGLLRFLRFRMPGYTIAHELCHLVHDRAAGRELALVSGPWAPRATERRANGFAAMLLMPAAIVQRLVGELDVPETSAKGVRALATAMNTSVSTTREHLGNLFEWDEGTRERLRGELVG